MKHGTKGSYSNGCRCEPCKAAKAVSAKRYRQRWPDRERERSVRWARNNPERKREISRAYELRKSEKSAQERLARKMASAQKAIENNRKRASEWQKKNREKRKIIEARWLKNNADKRKAYQALWLKANLGKHRAHQARRRGVKRQQTCSCCEKLKFNEFYSATPEGYEVDHKVPLSRGGMHCLKNLQYLTPADNRSKGARYAA